MTTANTATTPQNNRDAILTAALELFSQKGVAGSSIRQIAQRAGVSSALIFHHFESKEDLLREVLQNKNPLLDNIFPLLHEPNLNSTAFANRFITIYVDVFRPGTTTHQFFRLSMDMNNTTSDVDQLFSEMNSTLSQAIADFLEQQKDKGALADNINTLQAAQNFLGGFLWILINHMHCRDDWATVVRPLAESHVAFWLHSISAHTA